MRLEVRYIDHDGLVLGILCGQSRHDPGEDPHIAPPLPAVVQSLGRTILSGRVAPAQPIAVDEDNPTQDASVIDAGAAMALEERAEAAPSAPRSARTGAHDRGFLAEPESRELSEINGSGA